MLVSTHQTTRHYTPENGELYVYALPTSCEDNSKMGLQEAVLGHGLDWSGSE
jgi:hypothetical protein